MLGKQARQGQIGAQAGTVGGNGFALRRRGGIGWAIIEPVIFLRNINGALHPA